MSLLRVEDVTHYFAGLRAVSDFNLTLEAGELVALIGPNGAGKTTVFNLITGVYKPSEGNIDFADASIVGRPTHAVVARGIARTFQNIRLFRELTVLDNMRIAQYSETPYSILSGALRLPSFARKEEHIRERSLELLGAFGLADLAGATARNLRTGSSDASKSPARWLRTQDFCYWTNPPPA
jgi:branched-chain amino acid transport system ATP-binding protein